MEILNPSLEIIPDDMKPSIRVDDFQSIDMKDEIVKNMCRCCGEANATKSCSKCMTMGYCSKECQVIDWKRYGHNLICSKVT